MVTAIQTNAYMALGVLRSAFRRHLLSLKEASHEVTWKLSLAMLRIEGCETVMPTETSTGGFRSGTEKQSTEGMTL